MQRKPGAYTFPDKSIERESGTCYLCMKLHNNYRRYQALQEHHILESVRIGHIQDIMDWKYIFAMCIIWQEQDRKLYTQIRRSWPCCMKRDRELLRTGSAAGKSLWRYSEKILSWRIINMMDINDVKKLIDNVTQRPFFCSDTEITTIMVMWLPQKNITRDYVNTDYVEWEEKWLYFTDGQNWQQLLNRRHW